MRGKRILLASGAIIALAAFWPWLGNPSSYIHWKDRVRTSVPIALMFGAPCETYENGAIFRDISPNCYRFDEPREFKGIWLYEFEGSAFLENATVVPEKKPEVGSAAWLEYDPARIDPKPGYRRADDSKGCYPIHAFAIRFIGRRNPSGGGHMGLFKSEIWVERLLSAERLPSPNWEPY